MDAPTSPPVRLAYSYEDAGAQLGDLSRGKVIDLVTAGKLRVIKVGTRVLIPHSELERFISEQLGEDTP